MLGNIENCAWIDITAASTHNQTINRREAHRSTVRFTIQHRCYRATISYMAGNNLRVFEIEATQLGTALCHKLMACSVETIATHTILIVILHRESVQVVASRNRLVERSVENGNLWHRRQHLLNRENTLQVCRVVERSNSEQRANLLLNLLVYYAAISKELATMGYTMTYRLNLVERRNNAVLGICQSLQHKANTLGVVWNWLVEMEIILTYRLMNEIAFCKANTINNTLCEQFVGSSLDIEHLVLDRRATAIQY